MEIDRNRGMYLMMLYVYLKSYQEAIDDFEVAIKNIGYPDEALMPIKQKFSERMDRISKELAEAKDQ
jgi:hypothetical protein